MLICNLYSRDLRKRAMTKNRNRDFGVSEQLVQAFHAHPTSKLGLRPGKLRCRWHQASHSRLASTLARTQRFSVQNHRFPRTFVTDDHHRQPTRLSPATPPKWYVSAFYPFYPCSEVGRFGEDIGQVSEMERQRQPTACSTTSIPSNTAGLARHSHLCHTMVQRRRTTMTTSTTIPDTGSITGCSYDHRNRARMSPGLLHGLVQTHMTDDC